MEKFTRLNGIAAPLMQANVDTDMIIPKQFLKTIKRTGLGQFLFNDLRFTPTGEEIPGFVLNQHRYRTASILLAGENFGCGSSREHAPWALLDFGIKCVIAPTYADIFYNNCFKNGILPLSLPYDDIQALADMAPEHHILIDLEAQTVSCNNFQFTFDIDPWRKKVLLEGLDDIGQTLQHASDIDAYEKRQQTSTPWLGSK